MKPWTILAQTGQGKVLTYQGYDVETKLKLVTICVCVGYDYVVED